MAKKRTNFKKRTPQEIQEQLDAVMTKLEDGIKNMWSSNEYKDYLKTVSKFHRYSVRNLKLIQIQMPHFSRVASYTTWKQLGRQVNRNQKGIQILKPSPYKAKVEVDKVDSNGNRIIQNGKVVKEVQVVDKMGFSLTSVFDISQTSGKELPTVVERLHENGNEYDMLFDAIARTSPFNIVFEDTGTSGGYFQYRQTDISGNELKPTIAINENLSRQHQVKTLIHEITHSELHADEHGNKIDGIARELKEVQAESVAFVVCEHFGIDSSQYSFGYINGWASDKDLKELTSSLNLIKNKSSEIISKIENEVELFLEKQRSVQVEVLSIKSLSSSTEPTIFKKGLNLTLDNFEELYRNEHRTTQAYMMDEPIAFTKSDGQVIPIKQYLNYDCYFKFDETHYDYNSINMLAQQMGIPSNKIIDMNPKIGFKDLTFEEFTAVDVICKDNGSILHTEDSYYFSDDKKITDLSLLKDYNMESTNFVQPDNFVNFMESKGCILLNPNESDINNMRFTVKEFKEWSEISLGLSEHPLDTGDQAQTAMSYDYLYDMVNDVEIAITEHFGIKTNFDEITMIEDDTWSFKLKPFVLTNNTFGINIPPYQSIDCNEMKELQPHIDCGFELDVKITTPGGAELETNLSTRVDGLSKVTDGFMEQNINIWDIQHTYTQTELDFAYFEVKNSNLEVLTDGVYTENLFSVTANDEALLSDYNNAQGEVTLYHRNKFGVYSPTSSATVKLDNNFLKNLSNKLPSFRNDKIDFFKTQIRTLLDKGVNQKAIGQLTDETAIKIGRTLLECSTPSINDVNFYLTVEAGKYRSRISEDRSSFSEQELKMF